MEFTPLNQARTRRHRYPIGEVEVINGSLYQRKLGKKATIEIGGRRYDVVGIGCGLPGCCCDAYIKAVS